MVELFSKRFHNIDNFMFYKLKTLYELTHTINVYLDLHFYENRFSQVLFKKPLLMSKYDKMDIVSTNNKADFAYSVIIFLLIFSKLILFMTLKFQNNFILSVLHSLLKLIIKLYGEH